MPGQFDCLEYVGTHRTGFDQCSRLDRAYFVYRDLKNLLPFAQAHRPRLADEAANPDAVVSERSETMINQSAKSGLINCLPAWSTEGRVQGVDDPPQSARCPSSSFGRI